MSDDAAVAPPAWSAHAVGIAAAMALAFGAALWPPASEGTGFFTLSAAELRRLLVPMALVATVLYAVVTSLLVALWVRSPRAVVGLHAAVLGAIVVAYMVLDAR